jgi:putative endonuclease
MHHNQITGNQGEQLVAQWLSSKQVSVIHRNRRFGRYELDIVAAKNNVLICIEVKTRTTDLYGDIEGYISRKKICRMKEAAEQLLDEHEEYVEARLCIVSVEWKSRHPFFRVVELE